MVLIRLHSRPRSLPKNMGRTSAKIMKAILRNLAIRGSTSAISRSRRPGPANCSCLNTPVPRDALNDNGQCLFDIILLEGRKHILMRRDPVGNQEGVLGKVDGQGLLAKLSAGFGKTRAPWIAKIQSIPPPDSKAEYPGAQLRWQIANPEDGTARPRRRARRQPCLRTLTSPSGTCA